jgi:apolipoprotein N-acyltransferase
MADIATAAAALRERLSGLCGWRRAVVAALLGASATLAMAPYHLVPLYAAGLVGLLWLLNMEAKPLRAFLDGWCFGFGHFVAGLYWFAHALLTDAEKFAWLIPLAVSVIPAILAIFVGFASGATAIWGGQGWRRVLVFSSFWTIGEWLRSWVLTGLPWNLAGYVWAFSDPMNQAAALGGIFGLSFLTVATLSMPAILGDGASARWPLGGAILALLAMWVGGTLRIPAEPAPIWDNIAIRLVQPNIEQHHKWSPALRDAHLRRHIDMTLGPGWTGLTHVVWPEAAIPYFLDEEPELLAALGRIVPDDGLLFAGVPRITPGRKPPIELWNSLEIVSSQGRIAAYYDKSHLVPFGEYLPFRRILAPLGLTKLAHGMVDFSSGPGPRTVELPKMPAVSPLVCYEAIFPSEVAVPPYRSGGERPAWLLVLTNDAWFGMSTGPYQHFAMARLRAAEQGLPMLRSANTGISAFVDPYGRVVASLGLGVRGVLDGSLPRPLETPTLYARAGDALPILIIAAIILSVGTFRQTIRLK